MFLEFLKSRIVYCLLVFSSKSKGFFFFGTQCEVIYHAYISHVSRYSLDQKKVSSRSRLGHSRVSSRSRLGQFGKRLGLVSVSGAQVSVLVSVSTQKVLGPSLRGYQRRRKHGYQGRRSVGIKGSSMGIEGRRSMGIENNI